MLTSPSVATDDASVALRRRLSEPRASEAIVVLAAMGIAAELAPDGDGSLTLHVAVADAARAEALLAEADAEAAEEEEEARLRHGGAVSDRETPAESATQSVARPLPATGSPRGEPGSARDLVTVIALVAACAAVFLWSSGGRPQVLAGRMLEVGAVTASRIDDGEVWRLLTAVFLHFDLAHLLANMATLLLIGPLLVHEIGVLRFFVVFAVAGFFGNAVSYAFAPSAALKAGASGAIAGVLGALGGAALRHPAGERGGRRRRFKRWQVLGALAVVYALLVGAGRGSDHVAHLGGLVAGVLLGWALTPVLPPAGEEADEIVSLLLALVAGALARAVSAA